jgi:hypothetical protein
VEDRLPPVFARLTEDLMLNMSSLARGSVLAAATVVLAPIAAAGARAQQFIPDITISSTIPANGDLNPYGVAFVPLNFPSGGTISPGDILFSNFNNSSNVQGTGTTIIKLTPNGIVTPPPAPMTTDGNATTFFISPSTAIGLTTALGVLERGFVVVGNLPNSNGTLSAGSLQFINRKGKMVKTVTGPLLNGPWDLTIDDDWNYPVIYVSNVLNGTVVRLNLTVSDATVTVNTTTKIAQGYMTEPNMAALVLGPTGLAHDRTTDILYVASTADNAIFAVPNASIRSTPPTGTGTGMMIAQGGQLRGPLALVFAPNGDLVTSNGDALPVPISDPKHPSEIVELTKSGKFVSQFNVDAGQGGAFGIGIALINPITAQLAVVDDNANDIIVIDQNVAAGD